MPPLVAHALAFALALPPSQDAPPPMPAPPSSGAPTSLVDAAGKKIEPGVLPADTSPAAREAWNIVCEKSLAPGTAREPVRAFDLALDVRYKAHQQQSNDFQARFRFLAPSFLRATTESQREQLRGPKGDWLIDPKTKEKIPIAVDRAYAEDRRQLDDSVAIARNFVALTDPRSLRIVRLAVRDGAPAGLPPSAAARASTMRWLEIESPDFHLQKTSSPNAPVAPGEKLYRVSLGIDPASGLVAFALVNDPGAPAGVSASTLFIVLGEPRALDGFQVPHHMVVYEVDPASRPLAFRKDASSDIYLVQGKATLRAKLTAEDFLP